MPDMFVGRKRSHSYSLRSCFLRELFRASKNVQQHFTLETLTIKLFLREGETVECPEDRKTLRKDDVISRIKKAGLTSFFRLFRTKG